MTWKTDRPRATKTSLFDRNWAISLKPKRKSHPLRLVWWALQQNIYAQGGWRGSSLQITETISHSEFCSILHGAVVVVMIWYSAPSVYRPPFYRQNSRLSRFPQLQIPRYTAKLSYRHPPQLFRHKSRKANSNSLVSTTHNYLLTAVYWSVIMECQNWSSDTVIDLIVEGQNRWSGVLIRIITCIYFSSDYICSFNPE